LNPWDEAYLRPVAPPWEIGRPQPEFVRLADEGRISGRVIDVGCGTAENALMLAAHGLEVLGIDIAATAVGRGREKARERGIALDLRVWDALDLATLAGETGTFDCAIDSGVFHTFADEERGPYVESVAAAVRPGGHLFLMCFSEHEPGWGGPRRVTQAELREWFSVARRWRVESIRAARFGVNEDHPWLRVMGSRGGVKAWLATIAREATADRSTGLDQGPRVEESRGAD
jgi:SAM-dependent methyltransferase